jgi:hypothetical protein
VSSALSIVTSESIRAAGSTRAAQSRNFASSWASVSGFLGWPFAWDTRRWSTRPSLSVRRGAVGQRGVLHRGAQRRPDDGRLLPGATVFDHRPDAFGRRLDGTGQGGPERSEDGPARRDHRRGREPVERLAGGERLDDRRLSGSAHGAFSLQ